MKIVIASLSLLISALYSFQIRASDTVLDTIQQIQNIGDLSGHSDSVGNDVYADWNWTGQRSPAVLSLIPTDEPVDYSDESSIDKTK